MLAFNFLPRFPLKVPQMALSQCRVCSDWQAMRMGNRLGGGHGARQVTGVHRINRFIFQGLGHLIGLPQALCVQGMKCAHQAAIDNGRFDTAWLMTGLPDPLRRERFGGEPEELEVIGQYMKVMDDVEQRMKAKAYGTEDHSDDEEKPKGRGTKGKGDKKADA